MFQSQRQEADKDALEQLRQQGIIYPCNCTRAQFQADPLYQCNCLAQAQPPKDKQVAKRIALPHQIVNVEDLINGPQTEHLASAVGDFVVQRKDQLYPY